MINESLRLVRLYWGKSQSELAAELNISQSYLSEIERGHKDVTLELLSKYSDALQVKMSDLMFFAEEVENQPPPSKGRIFIAGKAVELLKRMIPDEIEGSREISD
ncbi:helix-turn-helix transcriptional regulator [Salinarimonas sp.]|uniref:helix-turn-helix domain-containing protein n=1 Tax=Salinarimonas sp. TaxID=2766526 RepID=UPI0032D8FDCD